MRREAFTTPYCKTESLRLFLLQVVLSAILPHYLDYLKTENSSLDNEDKLKAELGALSSLVTSINVLVKSSEVLTRSEMFLKKQQRDGGLNPFSQVPEYSRGEDSI